MTLVEVIVALSVLSVGLIALAGVAAFVTRMVTRGEHATKLAVLITERLEILAVACRGAGSGTEFRAPFLLRWTVAQKPGGARVTVSGSVPAVKSERAVTISRFVGCPA